MSYKDLLNQSQGQSKSFATFQRTRVSIKDIDKKYFFTTYNKETKSHDTLKAPQGVFMGTAMAFDCFDPGFPPKGGTYRSAPYFSKKDTITLFDPTGKVAKRGSYEEIEKHLNDNHVPVKKKMLIYLATEDGVLEIESNISVTIDLTSQHRDKLKTNIVKLTPTLLDVKGGDVSKKTVDILGKLAMRNPPKYAKFEFGPEITDSYANSIGLEDKLKSFIAWKSDTNPVKDEPAKVETKIEEVDYSNDLPF